jgi:hypothetical protein
MMKAALLEFGIKSVFRKIKKNNHWIVTLRNKDVVAISISDTARLGKKSRIYFNRNIHKYAKNVRSLKEYTSICFAIMVRRVQLNGYNGREFTESAAVQLLTKQGVDTGTLPELLGLKKKTSGARFLRNGDLRLFKKKKAVLLYSDRHIVVVSRGYYDRYGEAVKLDDEAPMLEKKKARAWFELKH